jgi:hypothetical protein
MILSTSFIMKTSSTRTQRALQCIIQNNHNHNHNRLKLKRLFASSSASSPPPAEGGLLFHTSSILIFGLTHTLSLAHSHSLTYARPTIHPHKYEYSPIAPIADFVYFNCRILGWDEYFKLLISHKRICFGKQGTETIFTKW